jgi:hypothetical protein
MGDQGLRQDDAAVDADPAPNVGTDAGDDGATGDAPREPRPLIERIGLAAIALLLALMFGGVSVASWVGGEPFLAVMGGIGCLMTIWVGTLTLLRG